MSMPRIVPDDTQKHWLHKANTSYLFAQDKRFDSAEDNRTALMEAWEVIELLIDRKTFKELVGE